MMARPRRNGSTPSCAHAGAIRWAGSSALVLVLPADPVEARDLLPAVRRAFRGNTAPPYRQAMGRALEAMAQRTNGAARSRLQLDAAQAYLDGGDRASARRMLASLAGDGTTPAALSASASGTLLRLLVDEGKMEEAERSLAQYRGVLSTQEMATLDAASRDRVGAGREARPRRDARVGRQFG